MRKELPFLATILIPLAFLILFLANNSSVRITSNPFLSPTPYPMITSSADTQTENITITPAASGNIEVISPLTGDAVKSGFDIKGNARVFENIVSIRLLDSQGNILEQTSAQANAPGTGLFGPFSQTVNFQTADATGTLEVYQISAKDGSEIDKVTVPVLFKQ